MHTLRTALLPTLALLVLTAGCSSSGSEGERLLTARQEKYCRQLGVWQKARDAARTAEAEPSGYDEADGLARIALLTVRPLRDESLGDGRTLGEASAQAMNNGDPEAEGRLVEYCADAGFETLTR
ncbi:hypothetical protein GTW46_15275 [Streptomyces sp. SID6013]|uniref:hypothetical protein n=1 Tax=Streptomyces sp. NPDC057387 TaxID=3346115 RepID=UPI001381938D|nr:hypothetical protein [Streptomyces sp. SID6013]